MITLSLYKYNLPVPSFSPVSLGIETYLCIINNKQVFLHYSPMLETFTNESKELLKKYFGEQEINFNFVNCDGYTIPAIAIKLIEKGFPKKDADILAENLAMIDISLKPLLEQWLFKGEEGDFSKGGMSVLGLKEKYNLEYQAALLTMDWIIKEPELALEAINKGLQ